MLKLAASVCPATASKKKYLYKKPYFLSNIFLSLNLYILKQNKS